MTTLIVLILLAVSSGMLFRWFLVLAGMLKGPVLAAFEVYGPEMPFFFPLPHLLFWTGTLVMASDWMTRSFRGQSLFPGEVLGGLFIGLAAFAHGYRHRVAAFSKRATPLPRWANRLMAQTSRHERRRIAYMWLRLPLRTRLLYNANNAAFFKWTELVILATL